MTLAQFFQRPALTPPVPHPKTTRRHSDSVALASLADPRNSQALALTAAPSRLSEQASEARAWVAGRGRLVGLAVLAIAVASQFPWRPPPDQGWYVPPRWDDDAPPQGWAPRWAPSWMPWKDRVPTLRHDPVQEYAPSWFLPF